MNHQITITLLIRILPHTHEESLPNILDEARVLLPLRGNFHSRRKINKLVHKHSPWLFLHSLLQNPIFHLQKTTKNPLSKLIFFILCSHRDFASLRCFTPRLKNLTHSLHTLFRGEGEIILSRLWPSAVDVARKITTLQLPRCLVRL